MNISGLNVRITIQENKPVTDDIGNHITAWSDIYSCWATAAMNSGSEQLDAGSINSTDSMDFTIRYTRLLDGLDSSKIRIISSNGIYNVSAINPMGFHRRSLKLKCEKVKR